MTPLWRRAFDAIERPLAAGSEAWIQSDTFMDLAAHSIRIQRRMLSEVQHATERWMHLWGWVSRGDVLRLTSQVANLEREVRELRREAEQRPHPLLNGRAPAGSRARSGGSPGRSGRARPAPGTPREARPQSRSSTRGGSRSR